MSDQSRGQAQNHSPAGFAGTLRNIQLTDIIQMCCLAGTSLCIRVRQDHDQGDIYIQDGELVHAECGTVTGVEAFFAIMGWQSGRFETLDTPLVASPSIAQPYQFLLMEAARRADEMAQAAAEHPAARPDAPAAQKIRVMIVDDSAIMSKILTSMLEADPGIEVVGNAKNGEEALVMMRRLEPDLITMDVNMPVMGGSTALKHIMIESPCPVLIMSNLGSSSYATILSFLNLGAVDFMSKPVKNNDIVQQQQRMVDRIHLAVKAKVQRFQRLRLPRLDIDAKARVDERVACRQLFVVVSGVGGYLEMVSTLTAFPKSSSAGVLSLQSIPPHFAPTLTDYLDARSPFQMRPLGNTAPLCPGRCYISTIRNEIDLQKRENLWCFKKVQSGEPQSEVHDFDRLLDRLADIFQDKILLILLSGGQVGTMAGLRAIHEAGGRILAPHLEKCILPASIAPVAEKGLITEMFDPTALSRVIGRY